MKEGGFFMECMEARKIFVAEHNYDEHGIRLKADVIDGKVVEISEDVQYYAYPWNPNVVHLTHRFSDTDFESELRRFIKGLYKTNLEVYKEFIKSIDDETLQKYFEKFYIPR